MNLDLSVTEIGTHAAKDPVKEAPTPGGGGNKVACCCCISCSNDKDKGD